MDPNDLLNDADPRCIRVWAAAREQTAYQKKQATFSENRGDGLAKSQGGGDVSDAGSGEGLGAKRVLAAAKDLDLTDPELHDSMEPSHSRRCSENTASGGSAGEAATEPRVLPDPIHRYRDQSAYRAAAGRDTPRDQIADTRDYRSEMAVVDLRHEQPTCAEFLEKVRRELLIRNYKRKSVKSYLNAITSFLRWSGRLPHEVDRELVRGYLMYLVESDKGFALVRVHSTAIRTVFDKFCFLDITLGLETPRRNKTQPVVLSKEEVQRLLEAAPTMRDKLILGLMYATGMRVSEVVRVRWREIDLDRNTISVVQGKGNVDRQVMLPATYRAMFSALQPQFGGAEFLFPAEAVPGRGSDAGRHLSSRTAQRVMKRAVAIAGIRKEATPHSLRHSFATHSFEDGCDIRRIQKVLGHVRLETTTIYVHIAKPTDPSQMPSPIDRLSGTTEASGAGAKVMKRRGSPKATKSNHARSNRARASDAPATNVDAASRDRGGRRDVGKPDQGRPRRGGTAPSRDADRQRSSLDLDLANGAGDAGSNSDSVVKLPGFATQPRIHVKRFEGEESTRITVEVGGGHSRVFLLGIRASESRPGFWTLSVPLLETWQAEIARLGAAQRRGIAEPEFYEFLRTAITNRLRQGDIPSGSAKYQGKRPTPANSDTPKALSGALAREGNSQNSSDPRVRSGELHESGIRYRVDRSARSVPSTRSVIPTRSA